MLLYSAKIEDILFLFPITGHYRYTPEHRKVNPALYFAKTPPPGMRKYREMSDEELEMVAGGRKICIFKTCKDVTCTGSTTIEAEDAPGDVVG